MKQSEMIETGQWWTDSLNVSIGCTKISPACNGCYAEKMAERLGYMKVPDYIKVINWQETDAEYWQEAKFFPQGWNGKIVLRPDLLEKPLHWRKPRIIFVDSMSDIFHESIPFEFIDKVMATIALCPQHKFLVLTKRIERAKEYFESRKHLSPIIQEAQKISGISALGITNPIPNLWLGVTCENQQLWAERTIPLDKIPAARKFISFEPLLSVMPIVPSTLIESKINWVVVGAETGAKARYCPLEWIEYIVEVCGEAGVPVWVKSVQIDRQPAKAPKIIHKFTELPESVRVRQSPVESK